jgi:multiple sugar transport system substrate-binding protein
MLISIISITNRSIKNRAFFNLCIFLEFNMMQRRNLLAATATLATTLCAPLAMAQQKTLLVASFPSFDEAVKSAIPLYKKVRPDVTIKLLSLSFGDHHNALVSSLATGTNLPDVAAVEFGYLGRLIESGALEDLSKPPYSALKFKSKLVPFTVSQATRSDGSFAAMPADIGPGTMFYRKDILDKAGVTEVQLNKSWESFIDAGKTIKAKTGVYLLPNAGSIFNVYIRSNIKSGDGIYFDSKDKPLLTSPRFVKAMELAKAVRVAGLDQKIGSWSNEWNEGFKRGSFAVEMSGAWLAGHLNDYIAPETKGLWRAANLPGGAYASWGGSFYGIPKKLSDDRKKMAWDFIEFMTTNKEMQLAAFRDLNAFPSLLEAMKDPFVDQPMPFLGNQKARQMWRTVAEQIPSVNVNKLDPVAEEILAAELDKVLETNKDIKTALEDAQKQAERRIRR